MMIIVNVIWQKLWAILKIEISAKHDKHTITHKIRDIKSVMFKTMHHPSNLNVYSFFLHPADNKVYDVFL